MAPSIGSTWRSFWHTMTSYDRHASHDSPYRTGQPLNSERHAPLTSIATGAVDSRQDLPSVYRDEPSRPPTTAVHGGANGFAGSPVSMASPSSPYAPGSRSASVRAQASENTPQVGAGPGEIPLQSFSDGLPPPPPVSHSWKRIDRWAEDNYQELFDQLAEGATVNDINELEHELDCSLPMDVRESLQIHDGQERGGLPSGIFFGCMLLDCEEIVQEWNNWRLVNQEYLSEPARHQPQPPSKALGSKSTSSSSQPSLQPHGRPLWRQELLAKQDSQPPNAIQKAYAHPGWIPLVRDWGGNNLAIDLAPGPTGRWGQIILFGRDYDCKYVVARSWAALLATVADDLGSEKWFVDEDSGELKLREFKSTSIEPGYFDILRWRTDQKYGRKGPKRKQTGPTLSVNPAGRANGGSSFVTPVRDVEPVRGRSMQRFGSGPSPTSLRPHIGKSSPLARVAEETPAPIKVHTAGEAKMPSVPMETAGQVRTGKLVEVATPVATPETTPRHSNEYQKAKKGVDEVIDALSFDHNVPPTPPNAKIEEAKEKSSVDGSSQDTGIHKD